MGLRGVRTTTSMNLSLVLSVLAVCEAGFTFDWYYYGCSSAVSKNAAITSQCKSGRGRRRGPDPCICGLEEYRLSMFNCLVKAADMQGTGEGAIKDSWASIEESCGEFGHFPTVEEMHTLLDHNPITQSYREANETKSGAFEPNPRAFSKEMLDSMDEDHWQNYWTEMFGAITVWYLVGIMVVQGIMHWSSYILPGLIRVASNNGLSRYLRRYIVLPALFRKHRAAPVKVARYFLLCFPPRLHVVFFIPYLFMSIFFLAYHYPYIDGDEQYVNYTHLVATRLAYRSGQLGMWKMPYLYLFGGRNNILIWFTGWQFEIFNHWHRWLGRLYTVDIFIHTVAYTVMIRYDDRETLSEWYQEPFMQWGVVGLVAMCIMCVNGTKSLRQLCYEFFLYFHIVLAVFTIVGTYLHIEGHEGWAECWAVVAVWVFDRVIRLARILIANPLSKATIKAHPGGTMEVTIKYSGLWKPRAGTYIFVHFLHSYHALQSHPFTVVPVAEKGEIKLFCKIHKGVTKIMYNRAMKQGGECQCRVMAEGPYGVEFSTAQFKEVVLIAGGIGMTAIYSHLHHIVKNGDKQIVHIHWAISNAESLTWFMAELESMTSYSNVHVIIHLNQHTEPQPLESADDSLTEKVEDKATSDSEVSTTTKLSTHRLPFRADFTKIVRDHIVNSQGDIVFFVCGPAHMSDDVRAGVAKNLFKTRSYVQFYEESFSM